MPIFNEIQDGRVKLWTPLEGVESQAIKQLNNVASLPWVFSHVAVMPDCHMGKGATVGSVIAMKDAISPSCVGVDIGCGMMAIKTSLMANDLPDNLKDIRNQIERDIPVGFNWHNQPVESKANSELMDDFWNTIPDVKDQFSKAGKQLGTLGGGNHFIELCLDNTKEQNVWMMLHSGSRGIGNTLAQIHINKAKSLAHNANLPDPDLAVFLAQTPEMQAYRRDLYWAQRYAYLNRVTMMDLYFKALQRFFENPIENLFEVNCHHNYVAEEVHFGENVFVTRKGAINADLGKFGIIPGSMGTKSYIVEGLGNPQSFNSASHGAGRRMSRTQAKKVFTQEDLVLQTIGVECRKDKGVIDEIPGAYKDIDVVMTNQNDLVKIVVELHQILCVKG